MRFNLQKYKQNNQEFLIGFMTAKDIIDNSKVLIYNQGPEGYQREPNQPHINKISKYITENNQFILPTAIVLGINKDLVNINEIAANYFEVKINDTEKFRIVDGQHRIEGLKKTMNSKPEILDFPLPVIIILSERRSIELEIFTDINSKAKRINTDLAQLAKHDYEIIENEVKHSDIAKHIAIKAAFKLKEKENSIWFNAIKFDIQTDFNVGIIGIAMFSDSIIRIAEKFKSNYDLSNLTDKDDIITKCENIADELANVIDEIWTSIIKKKWESAFNENYQINNLGESVLTFYDTKYYLQKGIGTKSINNFIGDVLTGNKESRQEEILEIKKYISNSYVKSDDWMVGGTFAGYNSESGFKKIKDLLLK